MQTFEYDPILESGFSHRFNQSSVKELLRTGVGDCFSYAKYRLYAEPWLSLLAEVDTNAGVHFGVVESSNGLQLYHLTSSVKVQTLQVDEHVEESINGGQTLITTTKGNDNSYRPSKDKEPIKALFFNTYEWSSVFRQLHDSINLCKPWQSTLLTLNSVATDIL